MDIDKARHQGKLQLYYLKVMLVILKKYGDMLNSLIMAISCIGEEYLR